MNKKALIAFSTLALVVVSGASMIALNQSGKKPISMIPRAEITDSTAQVQQKQVMKKEVALKEYSDPSGFRFLYPSDLNLVVENNESDPNMYASLKLKPASGIGSINIQVNDTNFSKLDEWIKANKVSMTSSSLKRTKLADLDAYQIPVGGQLVTGAYDEGALFTIAITEPKNEMLLSQYTKILSSFTFYQPQESQDVQQTSANSDSGVIEYEEVLQ